MFFYYCFSNAFGHDQVCWDEQEYGKIGDLLEANGSHFIALGNDLSWQSMYEVPAMYFQMRNVQIVTKLFGKQTLQLIHWMVYYYYTSYKSIVHLFVGDIEYYLKAMQKTKTLKQKDRMVYGHHNTLADIDKLHYASHLRLSNDSNLGQTLVVFPDLLSLKYRFADINYILSGQDGISKVMRYYYDLQHGYKNILITTGANICMDYKHLSQVICYFPETRYYKSQQNPRYHVVEALEKMCALRKARISYIRVK